jgi:predicted XRE-type DNA-binding protein
VPGSPPLKRLVWIAGSKRDLVAMPGEVQDVSGYAFYLAQSGFKHAGAKPLKGLGSAAVLEVAEDWKSDTYRAVYTVKFSGQVQRDGVRAALLSEESDQGDRHPEAGPGADHEPAQGRGDPRERGETLMEIEEGSTNVYADLGRPDADEMLVKAQLAEKIAGIIKGRRLTQAEAADIIGLPQPKLSRLLRGQFRGVSEAKMLTCLTRLGRDVRIVVGPARRRAGTGRIEVLSG